MGMGCEVDSVELGYTASESASDGSSCDEIALRELFVAIQMDNEDEVRMVSDNIINSKIDYKPLKRISDRENDYDESFDTLLSWTLLHECVRHNNTRILQLLIDSGANIEIKDGCGRTPLYYSCSISSADSLKVLLRAGANANPLGADGWSALMKATQEHKYEHVQALCENGANIMIGYDSFGRNALDIASLQSTGKMRVYKDGHESIQEAIANHKKVHDLISRHVSKTMPRLLWER